MKKISIRINKLVSRICAVGLSLLGFSCGESSEPQVMYGTPTGSFEIKGEVTSEDNKPVEGATLRVTRPDIPSDLYSIESTDTDKEGNYVLKGSDFPDDMKVVCIPDNPNLEADSVVVEMEYKKDPKNKNPWDCGHAEATVNFKLKNKKTE